MACDYPVRRRVRPALISALFSLSLALALPSGRSVHAQDLPPVGDTAQVEPVDYSDDIPAHIAVVDGRVTLEREGRAEDATENEPLLAGDRLRTTRGRVEVLFADGSTLALDEDSTVELLSESLMQLRAGRVRLSIARLSAEEMGYRVDGAGSSALLRTGGEYRISLDSRAPIEIDLAVIRGVGELSNSYGSTTVRAGSHATATERTEPSPANLFNASSYDPLDRWVEDQRDARYGTSGSAYLGADAPVDMQYYDTTLDQSGTWLYENPYGYVWYPRVASSWRPYSAGRWSFVASFGWTWIGSDRWSWPTHHYGRWGLSAGNRWFWIPGRHWAPAWVSWATAPGYVSWCPLGFDGRPAVGFASIGGRWVDPWTAWTVVPSSVFSVSIAPSRIGVRSIGIPSNVGPSGAVLARTFTPTFVTLFAGRTAAPFTPRIARDGIRPLRAPTAGRGSAVRRDTGTPVRGPFPSSRPTVSTTTPGLRSAGTAGNRSAGGRSNDRPDGRVAAPRANDPTTIDRSGDGRSNGRVGAGATRVPQGVDPDGSQPDGRGSAVRRGSSRTTPDTPQGAVPAPRGVEPPRAVPPPRSADDPPSKPGRGRGSASVVGATSGAPAVQRWPPRTSESRAATPRSIDSRSADPRPVDPRPNVRSSPDRSTPVMPSRFGSRSSGGSMSAPLPNAGDRRGGAVAPRGPSQSSPASSRPSSGGAVSRAERGAPPQKSAPPASGGGGAGSSGRGSAVRRGGGR
jgi:hypothetical protein